DRGETVEPAGVEFVEAVRMIGPGCDAGDTLGAGIGALATRRGAGALSGGVVTLADGVVTLADGGVAGGGGGGGTGGRGGSGVGFRVGTGTGTSGAVCEVCDGVGAEVAGPWCWVCAVDCTGHGVSGAACGVVGAGTGSCATEWVAGTGSGEV